MVTFGMAALGALLIVAPPKKTPESKPDSGVPARNVSVLVMPIEPLGGVDEDLALQVTTVLVAEASRLSGVRVQSYREIQGVLTQEQVKQAMGCDSATCAAELAGALNTDQIIFGTLGTVGRSYLLTLSCVTAAGETAGRTVTRFPKNEEEALIDGMSKVARELLVHERATEPTQPAPAAGLPTKPATTLNKPPKAGQELPSENGTQPYVWVPPGTATLGCAGKDCDDEDPPAHAASFSGFWMTRTEVTVASYLACVKDGECRLPTTPRDSQPLGCNVAHDRMDHPMNCVTYPEAQAFCDWEDGRVPNSDEWEYAARGGRTARFPWGNAPVAASRANFCDRQCLQAKSHKKKSALNHETAKDREREKERQRDMAVDDGYALTAPVGSYPQGANPWGLLDMVGNVREWSYTTGGQPEHHSLPGLGLKVPNFIGGSSAPEHEVVGGAWTSRSGGLVFHARDMQAAQDWSHALGFRCIRMTPRVDP
jgi:sulfatase modifying factor 1